MSADELKLIEHEAAAEEEAQATAEAEAEAEPKEDPRPVDPNIMGFATVAVFSLGNKLCKKYGVDAIPATEAAEAGKAIANVLAQYGVTGMSPRMEAWCGLALALGNIVVPRMEQYEKTVEGSAMPFTGSGGDGPRDLPDDEEATDGSA